MARVARRELLNAFAKPAAPLRTQVFDAQDGFSGSGTVDFIGAARGPDGRVWFFKATGPNAAVEKEKPNFVKFIESVRF